MSLIESEEIHTPHRKPCTEPRADIPVPDRLRCPDGQGFFVDSFGLPTDTADPFAVMYGASALIAEELDKMPAEMWLAAQSADALTDVELLTLPEKVNPADLAAEFSVLGIGGHIEYMQQKWQSI